MKKAFAVIAVAALALGTAGCSTTSKPVSGEVTKVVYKPETFMTGATWAAAMRTKSGEIIGLTVSGGEEELAAKVTVGACIVVSGVSSTDSNVGNASNVKVVSRHGPCPG